MAMEHDLHRWYPVGGLNQHAQSALERGRFRQVGKLTLDTGSQPTFFEWRERVRVVNVGDDYLQVRTVASIS